jgi:hypothetical protein
MDIENLITETFTAHEHVVPDGGTVLAAARRRIDRRRTVLSRPLVVAAGVAALTLAAVTVVALNRSAPTPADKAQAAAPADEFQAAGPVGTASTGPAVAGLLMPFSLDWLPPGSVAYLARRINIGAASDDPHAPPLYSGEYMLTVTANGQVLDVDVQQMRMMSVDHAAFKSGPGNPVTINGQRGVESSRSDGPGGYELYVPHRDGGSMYVNVSAQAGSTAPAKQLVDIGRRIAQNIRIPGTTTVTPTFGLRDLPNGMRICAFDVEQGTGPFSDGSQPSTRYSLGTCATMPTVVVGTNAAHGPAGTPGRPVQGHATRHFDENGYRTLQVLDAVNGAPVAIAGRVPLTDLYEIANRLVLPR